MVMMMMTKRKKTGRVSLLLSTRTAVPPDVPVLIQALLLPQPADLGAGDALVVAIVPLPDVLGDLDAGVALEAGLLVVRRGGGGGAVGLPGQVLEAEAEQLEGPLRTLAGRDESAQREE